MRSLAHAMASLNGTSKPRDRTGLLIGHQASIGLLHRVCGDSSGCDQRTPTRPSRWQLARLDELAMCQCIRRWHIARYLIDRKHERWPTAYRLRRSQSPQCQILTRRRWFACSEPITLPITKPIPHVSLRRARLSCACLLSTCRQCVPSHRRGR